MNPVASYTTLTLAKWILWIAQSDTVWRQHTVQVAFCAHFASTIKAEYIISEELYNCVEQFLT